MTLNFNTVVVVNICLLFLGFFLLFQIFTKIDTEKPQKIRIDVSLFDEYFVSSGFPDSTLNKQNLLAFFKVFNHTLPTNSVDSILIQLKSEELLLMPTNLDTLITQITTLKAKCDSYALTKIYKAKSTFNQFPYLTLLMLMTIIGMLGGVLANLRGFHEFSKPDSNFPEHLLKPYLIRPFTGLLVGLLVYFLSAAIGTKLVAADSHLISFESMVGFLALAIIAGFASQAFTERLLLAVNVLFAGDFEVEEIPSPTSDKEEQETKNATEAAVKSQTAIMSFMEQIQKSDPKAPLDPDLQRSVERELTFLQELPVRKKNTRIRLRNRS